MRPAESFRAELVDRIQAAVASSFVTIVAGDPGQGQIAAVRLVSERLGREFLSTDGRLMTGGYLSGFHDLVINLLRWSELCHPSLVSKHEQTLKRILPTIDSAAFSVPRDLTNSSNWEERTRFYHHEYQMKLLVGLAEFLCEALSASSRRVLLLINDADQMSSTSRRLIDVLARLRRRSDALVLVLVAAPLRLDVQTDSVIAWPVLSQAVFEEELDLADIPKLQRDHIYALSRGNPNIGRALRTCWKAGILIDPHSSAEVAIDFYLASQTLARREELALDYIGGGLTGDMIARRSAETLRTETIESYRVQRHETALAAFRRGEGPLVTAYALGLRDKFRRAEALAEPCEVLMGIGLYDTWFQFFSPLYADPDLRSYGTGDEPVNGLFINAAFVLYAMGGAPAAVPFLEEFCDRFPQSRFLPTALYAQTMTYGRYRIPVDLGRAETFAIRNLELIESAFRAHPKYNYIKIFAENAYAYIKARQGKLQEALDICDCGNHKMLEVYGDSQFKLHRSILIYNTSQVYELSGDDTRAETQLREAINCDPYYGEYYNDLANLLTRTPGREHEALAAYAQAIALSPPYYEAHMNRGCLRAQMGEYDGAVADFERVLEIKPQEWRAMRELGNVRLQAGDPAAAVVLYRAALVLEEGDADLHANIGLCYSELVDRQAALYHLRRALELNARHAEAHNNLAAELAALGLYDEALEHAEHAVAYGQSPVFAANRDAVRKLAMSENRHR
ncbi:tetratricopeptide repeat protein [Microvirga sp. VF16]|uniref:tetratricopeptide repeat protein n=1 Tax=Microvirga sp. VF16 TaxID=2807101 RepID=UPI00193D2AA5|nr:tetratricopeptide repeat protein [Microvirga sp. VF16]QRM33191.1 tetratricopeptide repeat protein [Microvirga sp. VF16]